MEGETVVKIMKAYSEKSRRWLRSYELWEYKSEQLNQIYTDT